MSFCNKTGSTYTSNPEKPTGLLPTKNGYEQFTMRPFKPDLTWVGINNKVKKK